VYVCDRHRRFTECDDTALSCPPKRKYIQNCNILHVNGTMQRCNNLIFVGFVHPLLPPKFFASYVTILHCGKASFFKFFGGPWVSCEGMAPQSFPHARTGPDMTALVHGGRVVVRGWRNTASTSKHAAAESLLARQHVISSKHWRLRHIVCLTLYIPNPTPAALLP
jgi:hypothetical protein